MKVFNEKILRINLKNSDVTSEALDIDVAKKFIGARGLGAKYLYDEIDPAVDALSPDNKMVIVCGPATGSHMPTGGRFMVITKSPLTGGIAYANSGGMWGQAFKSAGYDMLILEQQADKPVYIYIDDDKVEIKDASQLWGKNATETTEALQEVYGAKAKVMCIGQAGETLSRLACIMNDIDRTAGRGGVGAVMGSKNVKAIVANGTSAFEYPDADKAKAIAMEKLKWLREQPATGKGLPSMGTAMLVNLVNKNGLMPVKNWQGSFYEKAEDISGETLRDKYLVKKSACFRCPIACGRVVKNAEGKDIGGPEYETVWVFGANMDNNDLGYINMANELCNDYGMDTISAGASIACAMELYEKGYIKDEEIAADGLSFKWADMESVLGWLTKMAMGEGFGKKLAEGSYRLAESYGVPEYSMSVKKLDMPAYDARGMMGQGLNYATCTRGGCHIKGNMNPAEVLAPPEIRLDRFATEGRAKAVQGTVNLATIVDSLGFCIFTRGVGIPGYVEMVNACYGEEVYTPESIVEAAERIFTLEKLFNTKAGLTMADDTLPPRLLNEPIKSGPSEGHVNRLYEMLPEYYELRGWDAEGVPTPETLAKLGLA
ncbi:MAG: aldehyde ferredoxin oxidoreductase family protein [Defluviitaleaceae bacterium]|nr:aldehyde ferredoxin oxidoreductase family protein [Defluviitaleaceae bacterium]